MTRKTTMLLRCWPLAAECPPCETIRLSNMVRTAVVLGAVLIAGIVPIEPARAHGVAGARLFISTMLIDDPAVADEATLPMFFWLPQPESPGTPATQQYQLNFEWDKRITENFGFAIGGGYSWLRTPGAKT